MSKSLTKKPWESTTLWGAVAVVVVSGAKLLGYEIGEATGWATAIVTLIGGVVAVIGRVKAIKKIG